MLNGRCEKGWIKEKKNRPKNVVVLKFFVVDVVVVAVVVGFVFYIQTLQNNFNEIDCSWCIQGMSIMCSKDQKSRSIHFTSILLQHGNGNSWLLNI